MALCCGTFAVTIYKFAHSSKPADLQLTMNLSKKPCDAYDLESQPYSELLGYYALASTRLSPCIAPNYDDFYYSAITSPDSAPELIASHIPPGGCVSLCLLSVCNIILTVSSPLRLQILRCPDWISPSCSGSRNSTWMYGLADHRAVTLQLQVVT